MTDLTARMLTELMETREMLVSVENRIAQLTGPSDFSEAEDRAVKYEIACAAKNDIEEFWKKRRYNPRYRISF